MTLEYSKSLGRALLYILSLILILVRSRDWYRRETNLAALEHQHARKLNYLQQCACKKNDAKDIEENYQKVLPWKFLRKQWVSMWHISYSRSGAFFSSNYREVMGFFFKMLTTQREGAKKGWDTCENYVIVKIITWQKVAHFEFRNPRPCLCNIFTRKSPAVTTASKMKSL